MKNIYIMSFLALSSYAVKDQEVIPVSSQQSNLSQVGKFIWEPKLVANIFQFLLDSRNPFVEGISYSMVSKNWNKGFKTLALDILSFRHRFFYYSLPSIIFISPGDIPKISFKADCLASEAVFNALNSGKSVALVLNVKVVKVDKSENDYYPKVPIFKKCISGEYFICCLNKSSCYSKIGKYKTSSGLHRIIASNNGELHFFKSLNDKYLDCFDFSDDESYLRKSDFAGPWFNLQANCQEGAESMLFAVLLKGEAVELTEEFRRKMNENNYANRQRITVVGTDVLGGRLGS